MDPDYEQLREEGLAEPEEGRHRKYLVRGCLVLMPGLLVVILVAIIVHLALIVDASPYPYPRRATHPRTVVLVSTNDIHGYARGFHMKDGATGQAFTQGGLAYMTRMITALNDEWRDSFLWLDAGDQYQGGIESSDLVSNGSIITDVFNSLGLSFSSIGNHEFDYGPAFLNQFLNGSKFPHLAANIYESNTSDRRGFLPNTRVSSLARLGNGLQVGIIGLTTIETPYTTTWFKNKSNPQYDIRNYSSIVLAEAQALRLAGAHAVVLLTHVGNACGVLLAPSSLLNATTAPRLEECPQGEMRDLLASLPPGTVQAVVAGHVH
jgi:5'-nucleotidase